MKTITAMHFKGGTGKTTFCVMLSHLLAAAGFRVLAVDMDRHQNHLSTALGGVRQEQPLLRNSKVCASGILQQIVRRNAAPNLDVVALSAEWCDRKTVDPYHLKKRFRFFNLESFYDFVIIDTPPGMGNLQEISIPVADCVCIPTDLSALSLASLKEFVKSLDAAADYKIVPNLHGEYAACRASLYDLRKHYPGRVACAAIPCDEGFRSCVMPGASPFFEKVSLKTIAECKRLACDLLHLDRRTMDIVPDKAEFPAEFSPALSVIFLGSEMCDSAKATLAQNCGTHNAPAAK